MIDARPPDLDGLLCALILAPGSYPRNRFFSMFQSPEAKRVRRRARRVRSIVEQLTEPWPRAESSPPSARPPSRDSIPPDRERRPPPRIARSSRARVVGERVLEDGRVLLRYRVDDLDYTRTTSLEPLEAAALRYALHRAGRGSVSDDDRELVERALKRMHDLGAA